MDKADSSFFSEKQKAILSWATQYSIKNILTKTKDLKVTQDDIKTVLQSASRGEHLFTLFTNPAQQNAEKVLPTLPHTDWNKLLDFANAELHELLTGKNKYEMFYVFSALQAVGDSTNDSLIPIGGQSNAAESAALINNNSTSNIQSFFLQKRCGSLFTTVFAAIGIAAITFSAYHDLKAMTNWSIDIMWPYLAILGIGIVQCLIGVFGGNFLHKKRPYALNVVRTYRRIFNVLSQKNVDIQMTDGPIRLLGALSQNYNYQQLDPKYVSVEGVASKLNRFFWGLSELGSKLKLKGYEWYEQNISWG